MRVGNEFGRTHQIWMCMEGWALRKLERCWETLVAEDDSHDSEEEGGRESRTAGGAKGYRVTLSRSGCLGPACWVRVRSFFLVS